MNSSPKDILLNNIDDLDLYFVEGENELEFEIDGYEFVVTYSLENDTIYDMEVEEDMKIGEKLKILSINAYDIKEDEDIDVEVDDKIQKLFSDYYGKTLIDDNFEPLNVNFGEFSDFID